MSPGALLIARMQDGTGAFFDMRIGEVAGQGWRYIEESIPLIRSANRTYTERVLQPPFTLRALWLGGRRVGAGGGVVFLDSLQAVTPAGPVELASFRNVDEWRPLEDLATPGLYTLDVSEAVTRTDGPSAAFTWVESGLTLRGIRPGATQMLVPALVSREIAQSVDEGEVILAFAGSTSIPLLVSGTTEFFPTLDPRESPFLVADLNALLDYMYLHGNRFIGGDTEVWLRLDGTVPSASISASIEDAGWPVSNGYHASTMVEARTSDPLLTAGWSGLLALSFIAVVMAGRFQLDTLHVHRCTGASGRVCSPEEPGILKVAGERHSLVQSCHHVHIRLGGRDTGRPVAGNSRPAASGGGGGRFQDHASHAFAKQLAGGSVFIPCARRCYTDNGGHTGLGPWETGIAASA